ncbi:MAG: hypothetical protein WAM89_11925 [Terriglobales bacterium]
MSIDAPTKPLLSKGAALSLDTWAVIVAFLLALAVKFNIFKSVPW